MNSGLIPSLGFDSEGMPPGEAFRAYSQLVGLGFQISDPGPDFRASITTYRLGMAIVHITDVSALHFVRSAEKCRQDGMRHILLQMILEGGWEADFDGQRQTAGPGDILAMDMSRPMWKRTTNLKSITVGLARGDDAGLTHVSRRLHGARLQGIEATMFGEHLLALQKVLPRTPIAASGGFANATRHLFSAALAVSGALDADDAVQERIRRFILANLESPGLDAETVAKGAGLSRSALYRIFGSQGGIATYIRRQRLIHARRLLANPNDGRSVAAIAIASGFSDESHFSRAFKRLFGLTPGQMRANAPPMAPGEAAAPLSIRPEFERWVLELG